MLSDSLQFKEIHTTAAKVVVLDGGAKRPTFDVNQRHMLSLLVWSCTESATSSLALELRCAQEADLALQNIRRL